MGNSASLQRYHQTESDYLFISPELEQLCVECLRNEKLGKVFAMFIKDGSWMDRLAPKVPSFFTSSDQDTSFILPVKDLPETIKDLLRVTPSSQLSASIFTNEEQRLIFLSAISEDFLLNGDKNTDMNGLATNSLQDTFNSDDQDTYREEVSKVEEILLRPAMYFDEDNFISYFNETPWIKELPCFVDKISVPILILDILNDKKASDGVICYVNKNWEKMMKCKFNDCIGKTINEIMFNSSTEKEQIKIMNEAIKSCLSIKLGLTCQRKNGDSFFCLHGIVPIFLNNGKEKRNFRYLGIVQCDTSVDKGLNKVINIADEVISLLPFIVKNSNVEEKNEISISYNTK